MFLDPVTQYELNKAHHQDLLKEASDFRCVTAANQSSRLGAYFCHRLARVLSALGQFLDTLGSKLADRNEAPRKEQVNLVIAKSA